MAENLYESDDLLNQYLLFHYGRPEEALPYAFGPRDALNFPVRCVTECLDLSVISNEARALDIGCAVGRSTFELARYCRRVVGIDHSKNFVAAAQKLQQEGALDYPVKQVGEIYTQVTAQVPVDIDRSRITFETGDVHDLRPDLGVFDIILAANLLCRLRDPRQLLSRFPDLVVPGGQLVITTPNTWLEEFTPRKNWLGATPHTGDPLDALRLELKDSFTLTKVQDLPFLLREHARKFQWCIAQATTWQRL